MNQQLVHYLVLVTIVQTHCSMAQMQMQVEKRTMGSLMLHRIPLHHLLKLSNKIRLLFIQMSSAGCVEGESCNGGDSASFLKIMYRSLLPKLDELRVLAEDSNPGVFCITESWLSGEMCDNELSIAGYFLYRRDRDRHGGGVLLYAKESIQVKTLPQSPDLELLTLSLFKDNNRICLAAFYCPPSTSVDVAATSSYCVSRVYTLHTNFHTINIYICISKPDSCMHIPMFPSQVFRA